MKHTPKLIDVLIAEFQKDHDLHHIRSVLPQAKRFIFDTSSSRFMGELLRLHGKEILAAHEWAKTPYPTMWAEIDHRAYYIDGLQMPDYEAQTADTHFGVLYHHGRAYPCYMAVNFHTGKRLSKVPATAFWFYALHQPTSFARELEMAQFFGTSRLIYNEMLLGGVADVADPWWTTTGKEIARSHPLILPPNLQERMAKDLSLEKRTRMLQSHAGDLKIILTMLLLLTRPHRNMSIHEEGHRRILYRGKPLVLRNHSLITMHLAHDDPVKRYIDHLPSGITRADHDVRGHWAEHRIIGRGCHVKLSTGSHDWQPVDPTHYECEAGCGAKRWWHKEHLAPVPTAEYDVRK